MPPTAGPKAPFRTAKRAWRERNTGRPTLPDGPYCNCLMPKALRSYGPIMKKADTTGALPTRPAPRGAGHGHGSLQPFNLPLHLSQLIPDGH